MNRLENIATRIASDAKGIVGELYKANPETFKKLFPGESLFYAYAGKSEILLTCSNDNGKVAVFSPNGKFQKLTTWKELVPLLMGRAFHSLWDQDYLGSDASTLLKSAPEQLKNTLNAKQSVFKIANAFGGLWSIQDPKSDTVFYCFLDKRYLGSVDFRSGKTSGGKIEIEVEKLVEAFFNNLADSYDLDLDDRRRWQWLNREMPMQFFSVKNASEWVDRTLSNKDNMAMLAEIDPKAEQDFSKAKALLEQAYTLLEPYAVAVREKAIGKE